MYHPVTQLNGIGDFFSSLNKSIESVASPVNALTNTIAQSAIQFQQMKSVLRDPTNSAFSNLINARNSGVVGTPQTSSLVSYSEAPLSASEIRTLQIGLQKLGFDPGPIDGKYGPKTAAAIKAFQSRNYLTADGAATRWLYEMILGTLAQPVPPRASQPVASPPPVSYSAGSTGERFIPRTTQQQSAETPLSATEIRALQSALSKLGIDPGPIDGKYGPKTAAAIKAFQSRNYLSADGKLSRMVYAMAVNAANVQAPSPPVYSLPTFPAGGGGSPAPAPSGGGFDMGALAKWGAPVALLTLGGVLIVKSRRK